MLCLGITPQYGLPPEEQIRLLSRVGFDGFFAYWTPELDLSLLRRTADETGMLFQSIHAPHLKVRSLWHEDAETPAALAELQACLRSCAANSVPIMVTHAFIGFEDHTPTQEGIERFRLLVDEAEQLGVKIAFENTEGEEYLAALLEAFADRPHVGFCWDSGHELCYNLHDILALYGHRLMATHLNDNLGVSSPEGKIIWTDDLHLLPFDGIADWADTAARLKRIGFTDCLTFELKIQSLPGRTENDVYARMKLEDYLMLALDRARRVAALQA